MQNFGIMSNLNRKLELHSNIGYLIRISILIILVVTILKLFRVV